MNIKRDWVAVAILAVVSFLLYRPFFSPLDLPYRESIEPGYAGMARFMRDHPNPWGWYPLQYGGLPTQFMYLPALPYTAAALSKITGIEPEYAHRLITSTFAVLAPLAVYWFLVVFLGSKRWAFAVAFAYLVWSPCYGLIEQVDKDRGLVYLPWRLQVMAKYGEGPHNVGLAMLLPALIAAWRAATRRTRTSLVVAAIAMAAVTLVNWICALTLALAISVMLLSVLGLGRLYQFSFRRVFLSGALAYGLACFWLIPSLIQTTFFNWPKDAFGYTVNASSGWWFAGWIGGLLLIRMLFAGRDRFFLCFVTSAFYCFGYLVVAFYSFQHDTLPESRRYTPEFELFLFLAVGTWLWKGLTSTNGVHRFCAIAPMVVMLAQGAPQLIRLVTQRAADWKLQAKESTTEYQIARWLNDQRPVGRIFASGGLRFRLNAWFDLPQAGGTFETGLHTRTPLAHAYKIRTNLGSKPGEELKDAVAALEQLQVEYLVVHGSASDEYYRDFKNPALYASLPVAARFGADVIYRIPFTGPLRQNPHPGWNSTTGEFHASTEQKVFALVSACCWIGSIVLCLSELRTRRGASNGSTS